MVATKWPEIFLSTSVALLVTQRYYNFKFPWIFVSANFPRFKITFPNFSLTLKIVFSPHFLTCGNPSRDVPCSTGKIPCQDRDVRDCFVTLRDVPFTYVTWQIRVVFWLVVTCPQKFKWVTTNRTLCIKSPAGKNLEGKEGRLLTNLVVYQLVVDNDTQTTLATLWKLKAGFH